ncbi:MAG: hypothetical protein L0211_15570 [Planctomycetaceae bacterium]|nr:hypothetical protein [Planctomycetaceae bacterium]
MARTSTIVIVLLIGVGLVVAMLPAQDSSRRRASVYAGVTDMEAEVAPAPEPGLIPVDGTSPAPTPLGSHFAAPPIAAPSAAAPDHGVSPAGIFDKIRGSKPSVTSQFDAATEAISQEYTPTPAEGARPADAPADNEPSGSATEPPADGSSGTRSVLKRIKTAPPEESPSRPPLAPSIPAGPRPTNTYGGSSRRSVPTPAASGRTPTLATTIDTRSITAVAISGRSPALRVDVAGPQGITVGKPAGYLVTIVNEGDTSAGDVQLRISLPAFVSVAGSQASSGEAGLQADAASGGSRVFWVLPGVAARGHESLRLELVASEGRAFELGVEWAFKPAAIKAAVAVKQAQLQLSLAGPSDMTFGEEKTFTLAVANPGNGDADNVVINLSSGEGRRQQFEVGTLPAGQRKEVSVQIVASQAGEMEIHAQAAADGGLSAEAAGRVIIRKAELAVAVAGPELKFAGTEATYQITIQNTGNAPADNVQLAASLPVASRFVGGIEGASPSGSALKWKLTSLPAGSERTFEVRLVLNGAGANRLAVQAQAPSAGTASGEIETLVEAAADLKLSVNDPSGPLATSELATYEVQVTNRGSDAARQVKIVMQFGEGIEPIAFEGAEGKIVPGQVVCQPLNELGPGEQVTMRVKARADRAGTHQFRVEVIASESESRLVSEGTTRFFAESGRGGSAAASTARKPTLVPQGGTYQR